MAGKKAVPRVRFTRAFIFTPSAERRVSTKYRADWDGPVPQECADQAVAAGAAELLNPEKNDGGSRGEAGEGQVSDGGG